jgi:hypothetical protein
MGMVMTRVAVVNKQNIYASSVLSSRYNAPAPPQHGHGERGRQQRCGRGSVEHPTKSTSERRYLLHYHCSSCLGRPSLTVWHFLAHISAACTVVGDVVTMASVKRVMTQTQSLSTEGKAAATTHLHDNIASSQAATALDREQKLVRALFY